MTVPQKIRTIVFDLDGVLVNSTSCHRAAFEKVFDQFGISDFDYSMYAGWRTADVIEDVFRRANIEVTPETVARSASRKSQLAREAIRELRPIAEGAVPVLRKLSSQYQLALATSGSLGSARLFIEMIGPPNPFESVLTGEDVTNAKPHPEIYSRTLLTLNTGPSECLVVEDSIAGVEAAHAAGATVVGIAGTVPLEQLKRAGAVCVIGDLRELPQVVAEIDGGMLRDIQPDPDAWTAVIPAAGRGTRLNYHRPKILFPVAGRPILDWLLDVFSPNCRSIVFVLSPEGANEVATELEHRVPGRFSVVVQETPTGMGDAVALALPSVRTPHVAIAWGDQAALRRESVEMCLCLHQGSLRPDLTCPTVFREDPYIHFDRDGNGRIIGLRQKREGDSMPDRGESDTGFFCFRTPILRSLITELRGCASDAGTFTREFNLLPVIPMAARLGLSVLTPQLMRFEETVGVNSKEDAAVIEKFLLESYVYSRA